MSREIASKDLIIDGGAIAALADLVFNNNIGCQVREMRITICAI
jgi:hypothetical protein